MIAATVAYPIEGRWIPPTPGVRVVRTPVGVRAPEGIDLVAGRENLSLLLATGFCGGLRTGLRIGSLVLADVVRHRGKEILVSSEILAATRDALASKGHEVHVGACECIEDVADPQRKRELAASGALSVDMESGPLAAWAVSRGVPFLSLRVVLDPVDVDLPFPTEGSIMAPVFRHPIAAIRVGRSAVRAGRALGRALGDLLPELRRES